MRESDALKKWCPMARDTEVGGSHVSNRQGFVPHGENLEVCLGSNCMVWVRSYGHIAPSGRCGLVADSTADMK